MTYFAPPYKGAGLQDITQHFTGTHLAVDFCPPNPYGKFLCSPVEGIVWNVITDENIYNEFDEDFKKGYGVMIKERNENRYHVYWHCMQVFPVSRGMTIRQGQPIAQMGNSGICYQNGVLVESRPKLFWPYPGTHLHYEMFELGAGGERTYLNPLPLIDFKIPLSYSLLDTIKEVLDGIQRLLNRKVG